MSAAVAAYDPQFVPSVPLLFLLKPKAVTHRKAKHPKTMRERLAREVERLERRTAPILRASGLADLETRVDAFIEAGHLQRFSVRAAPFLVSVLKGEAAPSKSSKELTWVQEFEEAFEHTTAEILRGVLGQFDTVLEALRRATVNLEAAEFRAGQEQLAADPMGFLKLHPSIAAAVLGVLRGDVALITLSAAATQRKKVNAFLAWMLAKIAEVGFHHRMKLLSAIPGVGSPDPSRVPPLDVPKIDAESRQYKANLDWIFSTARDADVPFFPVPQEHLDA